MRKGKAMKVQTAKENLTANTTKYLTVVSVNREFAITVTVCRTEILRDTFVAEQNFSDVDILLPGKIVQRPEILLQRWNCIRFS